MATYTRTSMGYNLLPSKYTHIYIYCDNKRVLSHIEYMYTTVYTKKLIKEIMLAFHYAFRYQKD